VTVVNILFFVLLHDTGLVFVVADWVVTDTISDAAGLSNVVLTTTDDITTPRKLTTTKHSPATTAVWHAASKTNKSATYKVASSVEGNKCVFCCMSPEC